MALALGIGRAWARATSRRLTRCLSTPPPPSPGRGSADHGGTYAVVAACYFGAGVWLYRDYLEKPPIPEALTASASAPSGHTLPGLDAIITELYAIRDRIDAMDATSKWMAGGCCTGPLVAVGTGGGSEDVHLFRLGPDRSQLVPMGKPVRVGKNPSFVSASKDRAKVYVAHEGAVSALSVDLHGGSVSALGGPQSSCGAGTCYVEPDREGKHVLAANYVGGSVCVLPVGDGGAVGPATDSKHHDGSFKPTLADRQEGAHPHSIRVDPWGGKWALVPDLGRDQLMVYEYDADRGVLAGATNSPRHFCAREGAGPRHLAFSPPSAKGKTVYLLNELDATVSVLSFDAAAGTLAEKQTVSLLPYYVKPDRRGHCGSAEVAVHPSGKFVYASNRTNHSISVLKVDEETGHLALTANVPCGGRTPRHFQISPQGDYLVVANQSTNSLATFGVDQSTGTLSKPAIMTLPASPRCVCIIDDEVDVDVRQ